MPRWLRLRVRPGTGFHGPDRDYRPGDEFVVSYADAATFLQGKGRRGFELVDDFVTDSESPPEGAIAIGRLPDPHD